MSALCQLEGIFVPTVATTHQAASTAHAPIQATHLPLMDAAARVKETLSTNLYNNSNMDFLEMTHFDNHGAHGFTSLLMQVCFLPHD